MGWCYNFASALCLQKHVKGELLHMFYDYMFLYRIYSKGVRWHLYGFGTAKNVHNLTTCLKKDFGDKNMNHESCKHKGIHFCRLDVCLFTYKNFTSTKLAYISVFCNHT